MLKSMDKQIGAFLLLLATVQFVSGATIGNGRNNIPTLERDEMMAQTLADTADTMKCLSHLQNPEINDKISSVWTEHLDRLQLHPTKPLNPNLSMDVLYEKAQQTLKQLQAVDEKCSTLPYPCRSDDSKNVIEIPQDLKDMEKNLDLLAGTMRCVLGKSEHQKELYRIFDNSFERIHSSSDAAETALIQLKEENQETIKEIQNLDSKCENVEIVKRTCS